MLIRSSKGYTLLILLAVACLVFIFWRVGRTGPIPLLRLDGKTMGTTWSVLLGKRPAGVDTSALHSLMQQELDHINKLMSTYDKSSEISRFNDSNSTQWFPVSTETAQVVELARKISILSNGAFDVTVGPLVDLWGFGSKPRGDRTPADDQVEALRKKVGYKHLKVRLSPAALRKDIPGLRVDLSAIAKGYAVDKLAEIVSAKGFADMVVEIGGEMLIKGRNPNGKLWRIAVEKPVPGRSSAERVFSLAATGMATSGNYRNFFVEDGQRYGHTIDPATGRPVRHRLASVTVLSPTCAEADALATALMAMGDDAAEELCRRHKISAYLLVHQGEEVRAIMSETFKSMIDKAAQ